MLSPIVDDVDAGAAIAGIVRPVHGYALNFGAKSAGDEMPIGFVACDVRTSQRLGSVPPATTGKVKTGIISSRYRLLVDQGAPSLYQLLQRALGAHTKSQKLEEEP